MGSPAAAAAAPASAPASAPATTTPTPPADANPRRRGPTGARATRHVYNAAHVDARVLWALGHDTAAADGAAASGAPARKARGTPRNSSTQQHRRLRTPRRPSTAPARGAEREELERQRALAATHKSARVRWRGAIRVAMLATGGFVAPGLGAGNAPASTGPLSGAMPGSACITHSTRRCAVSLAILLLTHDPLCCWCWPSQAFAFRHERCRGSTRCENHSDM
jgi:hypothetical protein